MKTILKALFVTTLAVFFFSQGYSQTAVKSGFDRIIRPVEINDQIENLKTELYCCARMGNGQGKMHQLRGGQE